MGIAQLVELCPSGRSPNRRAIKDNDGALACPIGMQRDRFFPSVREREVVEAFSDLGTGRVVDGQSETFRVTQRCRRVEFKSISLDRYHCLGRPNGLYRRGWKPTRLQAAQRRIGRRRVSYDGGIRSLACPD